MGFCQLGFCRSGRSLYLACPVLSTKKLISLASGRTREAALVLCRPLWTSWKTEMWRCLHIVDEGVEGAYIPFLRKRALTQCGVEQSGSSSGS